MCWSVPATTTSARWARRFRDREQSSAGGRFIFSSLKALAEQDGELRLGPDPLPGWVLSIVRRAVRHSGLQRLTRQARTDRVISLPVLVPQPLMRAADLLDRQRDRLPSLGKIATLLRTIRQARHGPRQGMADATSAHSCSYSSSLHPLQSWRTRKSRCGSIICVPMEAERAERLNLAPMVANNVDPCAPRSP